MGGKAKPLDCRVASLLAMTGWGDCRVGWGLFAMTAFTVIARAGPSAVIASPKGVAIQGRWGGVGGGKGNLLDCRVASLLAMTGWGDATSGSAASQ